MEVSSPAVMMVIISSRLSSGRVVSTLGSSDQFAFQFTPNPYLPTCTGHELLHRVVLHGGDGRPDQRVELHHVERGGAGSGGRGRGAVGTALCSGQVHYSVWGRGRVSMSNCSVVSTYQGLGGPGVELPVYPLFVLLTAQPSLQSSAAQQCYL